MTYHTVLNVDRGLSWEAALEARDTFKREYDADIAVQGNNYRPTKAGFYVDNKKYGELGDSLLPCQAITRPLTLALSKSQQRASLPAVHPLSTSKTRTLWPETCTSF